MELSNKDFQNKDDSIDLKKILFKVLNNWYYFVISVFITLSISFFINRYTQPIFVIESSILVKDKDNAIYGGVESIVEELGLYRRSRKKSVENEIGVLKSYQLVNRTINELNFNISYFSIGRINTPERYKSSPFIVKLDTTFKNKYGSKVYITMLDDSKYKLEIEDGIKIEKKLFYGEEFSNKDYKFSIYKNEEILAKEELPLNKFYFVINDLNSLTKIYKNKLSVDLADKKGTILFLKTTGLNPAKEVDFLNKLSEKYIEYGLEEKNQITQNTINFIDNQLSEITDSLKIAERNLLDFRLSNKIIDISKEGNIIFDRLEKVQNEKILIDIRLKYYEYLFTYIQNKSNFKDVIAPSVMGIEDPLLNSLIISLGELYAEKEIILYSAKENTPSVNLANIKIQNTRESLLENVKNLIITSKITSEDIESRIKKIESEIQKLPVTERQLLNVQRKFNLSDNIYTYLLQKRAEAGIAQASNIPDNKILDEARGDNAVIISPKKSLNYLIALIIGFIIPLVIIILLDFFNNKINERKDIEDYTNIPIIGSIGHNNKETDMVVFEKPKSSISESFRTLRTNIQYLLHDKSEYVISITSTVSGEGKTFCAINLGSIIAISNKKTLLVGLDLRKPKLHKDLNIANDIGMSTYLIGKSKLEDIIVPTKIENLYVIPSGPIPPNPAELLESKRFADFINIIKEKFEYIILDTPPVALVTDALLLSKYTDANLYVIRQNYSNKSVVKLANELYKNKAIKNISILINDVKVPSYYGIYGKYNYSYGGYYSYGYGTEYGSGYYEDDNEHIHKQSLISRIIKIMFNK